MTARQRLAKHSSRESLWLFGLLLVSLLVRLIVLGVRPFDGDEGVIVDVITQPTLHQAIALAKLDVHPFFLMTVAWPAVHFFGLSEFSARIVPALASVGIIYLTFLFWKKISTPTVAWIVTLLVAVSPEQLYFSQELRFYALLCLFTVWSLYLIALMRERFRWPLLWLWVLVNLALVNTQHIGLIVVAAELVAIAYLALRRQSSLPLRPILIGVVVTGLLYLPTLPITIHQFTGRLGGESQTGFNLKVDAIGTASGVYRIGYGYLEAGVKTTVHGQLAMLEHQPASFALFYASFAVLLYFLGYGFQQLTAEERDKLLPFLAVGVLMVLASLASQQVGQRASRNLYLLLPLYFGLIGVGIAAALRDRSVVRKLSAVFLVGCVVAGSTIFFEIIQRPGVNTIAAYIDAHEKPGDIVLDKGTYLHGESTIFNYYSKTHPPIVDYYGNYAVGNLASLNAVPVATLVNQLLATHQRVWFYDMTGDAIKLPGTKHVLGVDKESNQLAVWEVTR